jgi:hypothetical protein
MGDLFLMGDQLAGMFLEPEEEYQHKVMRLSAVSFSFDFLKGR